MTRKRRRQRRGRQPGDPTPAQIRKQCKMIREVGFSGGRNIKPHKPWSESDIRQRFVGPIVEHWTPPLIVDGPIVIVTEEGDFYEASQ